MTILLNILLTGLLSAITPIEKIYSEGIEQYRAGNYQIAYEKFSDCINNQGDAFTIAGNSNIWAASCLFKMNKIKEAGDMNEGYELEPVDGRKTRFSDSLSFLANRFLQDGEYEKAALFGEAILQYEIKALGPDHYYVGNSYIFLANCYNSLNRLDESKRALENALQIASKQNSQSFYYYIVLEQCFVLSGMNEWENSYDLISKEIFPNLPILSETSRTYAEMLQAQNCFETHRDNECLHLCEKVMKSEVFDANNNIFYNALLYYSMACVSTGAGKEAVKVIKNHIPGMILRFGKSSTEYADLMYRYAAVLGQNSMYSEAHRIYDQVLSIGNQDYSRIININIDQAWIYRSEGNVVKALELLVPLANELQENMASVIAQNGEESPEVQRCIGDFENLYSEMMGAVRAGYMLSGGNEELRMTFKSMLMTWIEGLTDSDNVDFLSTIISTTYRELAFYADNANESIKYLQEALLYSDKPREPGIKCELAFAYNSSARFDEALSLCRELSVWETSNSRLDTDGSLKQLYASLILRKNGDTPEMEKTLRKSFAEFSDFICSELVASISIGDFWNVHSFKCLDYVNFVSRLSGENPHIYETAFNAAMLYKGLLLSVDREIERIIEDSADSGEKAEYLKLCEKRKQTETMGFQEQQKTLADINRKILDIVNRLGDFTEKFKLGWRDVQRNLSDKEIAIEFAISQDDMKEYLLAMLLRKGWEYPRIVKIPISDTERTAVLKAPYSYVNNAALYGKIWEPIIEKGQIKDGEKICFSPYDFIYNFPFEYMRCTDGRRVNERFTINRISSTRDLCVERKPHHPDNAVLYGGLQYSMSAEVMKEKSRNFSSSLKRTNLNVLELNVPDSTRTGIAPLPKTLTEVNNISTILAKSGVANHKHIGDDGIEESFKALSGVAPSIIHMATHGFYYEAPDATKKAYDALFKESLKGLPVTKTEALKYMDPMSRAGLIMSGGQMAFSGAAIPEIYDDGILTAKEISELDLSNTDLVVLSACQTGMGDICGDGVFGLQRGFKKAGVRTILMSLWKVDDEATSILMNEFYRNYFGRHMTAQKSLSEAQRYLREFEVEVPADSSSGLLIERLSAETDAVKGETRKVCRFNNPRFWAGFILLDADNKISGRSPDC